MEPVVVVIRCDACKEFFEYEPLDDYERRDPVTKRKSVWARLECPSCFRNISVPKRSLPALTRRVK